MEKLKDQEINLLIKPVYLSDLVKIHYGKRISQFLSSEIETDKLLVPLYSSGKKITYTDKACNLDEVIILSRVGTVGHPRYVDKPFNFTDNTIALTVKDSNLLYLKYLYYFLLMINFEDFTAGSVIPYLHIQRFKQIIFSYIPVAIIEDFEN